MFEMKNESDRTATKNRNEDFLKELDKDRTRRAASTRCWSPCWSPTASSTTPASSTCSTATRRCTSCGRSSFMPIITLLRNAAMNSLKYKSELAL
jgi:hypothetical protein